MRVEGEGGVRVEGLEFSVREVSEGRSGRMRRRVGVKWEGGGK